MTRPSLRLVAALLMVAILGASCSDDTTTATDSTTTTSAAGAGGSTTTVAAAGPLVGLFKVDAGQCDATGYSSGSYFKMVFPGGTVDAGKFFDNPDSTCPDKAVILVSPGTDGGLSTNDYQPDPAPAFDAAGNALASRIIQPQAFTAIKFSVASNPKEPQTGLAAPKPAIRVDAGKLSGDVSSVSGEWNQQVFSQGSPKPDGTRPGLTTPVSGTYDASTGAYVLEWASQIQGGPFNDFTGVWHLEGTFVPAKS